jgi:hypothetical protein
MVGDHMGIPRTVVLLFFTRYGCSIFCCFQHQILWFLYFCRWAGGRAAGQAGRPHKRGVRFCGHPKLYLHFMSGH